MKVKSMQPATVAKLVLSPIAVVLMAAIYGFIAWTVAISFTTSRLMPRYDFAGLDQYRRLWAAPVWNIAVQNFFIFGTLFIAITICLGLFMAILLDQKIRGEAFFRTVFLYPMALSLIVTGTSWKWILNPQFGVQKVVNDLGFTGFEFDWITNPKMAIFTIVMAAIWQASGLTMAIFLAALRGVDTSIIQAAQMEGAGMVRIYRKIIIPSLGPALLSAFIILTYTAVRTFDLVVAMTGGGPGSATEMPSTFMFGSAFRRSQLAVGAASAVMMLLVVAAVVVPHIVYEVRSRRDSGKD